LQKKIIDTYNEQYLLKKINEYYMYYIINNGMNILKNNGMKKLIDKGRNKHIHNGMKKLLIYWNEKKNEKTY